MKLKVSMFAAARQLAQSPTVELEFEHPPTVTEVQTALVRLLPDLETVMARSVMAVNQEYAMPDQVVLEGSELAMIPPVSGG